MSRSCLARKVFVIGLDGATLDLIGPWAAQGELPTLSRLMREGVSGELRSVIPPITAPAWASFLTGKNPGNHGLFSLVVRKPGSYEVMPFNATYIRAEDLGGILSRHGLKVGFVNVPCTYPPREVNGFLVTGMETPLRGSEFTYPQSLQKELIKRFDYEVERTQRYRNGAEDEFLAVVEAVEEKRTKAVLYLMEKYEWDLFVVVFRGTDILAHSFWRFMDPEHPKHDPGLASKYGDSLLRHYQQMDQAIKEIWSRLDESTTLVLMSDHGSGRRIRDVHFDNLFLSLGLMKVKRDPASLLKYELFKTGMTIENVLSVLSKLGIRDLMRKIMPAKARYGASRRLFSMASIDLKRSKAFPLGGLGQIYINVKGREPEGRVEPGEEYEKVVAFIESKLRELRDPDTGEPIVSDVLRKEDIYPTHQVEGIPDLYVTWKNDEYADVGAIGYSRGIMSPILREPSGTHTMRGIFFAQGPGIKKGATVSRAEIIDVAPTILYLLGLPVPADMDGQVLEGIFEEGALEERPVAFEGATQAAERPRHQFSPAEQEAIEERLKGLGYL